MVFCSSDREKFLEFEAEGREFAKILRSLEQLFKQWKVPHSVLTSFFYFPGHGSSFDSGGAGLMEVKTMELCQLRTSKQWRKIPVCGQLLMWWFLFHFRWCWPYRGEDHGIVPTTNVKTVVEDFSLLLQYFPPFYFELF